MLPNLKRFSKKQYGDALKTNYSISVFLPCFNEETNLSSVVNKSLRFLDATAREYELIIINDGSTDKTGNIADRFSCQNPRVRVIHHVRNMGYGSALRSGFRAAQYQLVFFMDGDGQFDIQELGSLLDLMDKWDIISCYRLRRQDTLIRRGYSAAWSFCIRNALKLRIRDVNCAFKLFRRQVIDDMPLYSTGALINAEILTRAKQKGWGICQKGVSHYPRLWGRQTGGNLSVIFKALHELLLFRSRILSGD